MSNGRGPASRPLQLALVVAAPLVVVMAGYSLIRLLDGRSPRWIEIGDRFRYANKAGAHTLEWSDVTAIDFEHDLTVSPDVTDYRKITLGDYDTYIVVPLVTGETLRMTIGGSCSASTWAASIVQTLVRCQIPFTLQS